MASIESASALITGISLAVTSTELIINAFDSREEFNIGSAALSASVLFTFGAFYGSLVYLHIIEFGPIFGMGTNSLNDIFLVVFILSALGISFPFVPGIRNQD